MNILRSCLVMAALSVSALLTGCSSSSSSTPPPNNPITVTLSAPPASLQSNAAATLTAVVANDPANAGVSWSCAPAGNCGSFNPTTSAGSTGTTTYTAPANAGNVTITATSVTDSTKSAQATITITAAGAISVTLNPAPPASLQTSATTTLTAVVANDPTNAGVTWSCAPSGSCGSFNPTASAGSTATTTYTAPPAVPAGNTVTVIATSVTDPTKSAQAAITITAAGSITVTLGPTPASLQAGSGAAFTAFVGNDSTNAGVTWTATCGGNPCGSFSAGNTASGTATDFSTAGIAAGSTLTITAASVANNSATASATVNVTNAITSLADGTYVFSLGGQDQFVNNATSCAGVATIECAPYYVAGAFVVSGGTITGGEQDFIDLAAIANDTFTSGGVTQSGDATGNLLITLNFTRSGVPLTETLNGTLVSASRALITEFDGSATASGSLDLQESTITAPSGGYAFFVAGLDGTSSPAPANIGGVINVDGSPISGNGSVFDINDAGLVSQNQSFAANASTVSAPDQFGRVVFNLVPSSSSLLPFNLVGYVVGPRHIRLVETSDSFNGTTGGVALGQGSDTGTFSSSSIAGSSFVVSASGADTQGAFQVAGVLTANADGTVSGTLNANDLTGSGVQSPIAFSGSYAVDASGTGRVTLSSLTGGGLTVTGQLYLSGLGTATDVSGIGTATFVSMDATDVLSGFAYQQTGGGSFTPASFFGTYGMNATGFDFNNELEFDAVGPVSVDGASALSGAADLNFMAPPGSQATVPVSPAAFAADPSGGFFTGTITGLDIDNPGSNDAFTYYPIDTTKVIAIETDPNQLTLIYFALEE